MSDYTPRPEHKFTFGLWTVGNPGRDPFGEPTRAVVEPVRFACANWPNSAPTASTCTTTTWCPSAPSPPSATRIVTEFKKPLADTGMKVPMATTNLFTHPDLQGRRVHLQRPQSARLRRAKDDARHGLGRRTGRETYVFWGGREGSEVDAAKNPLDPLKWLREALNFLNAYQARSGLRLQVRA